jgi:prepilin-type N-terminal cleavage/methylation domain-containing protein
VTASPSPARLRSESGLTLAEILVALAVAGVALAALAVTVPVSSYAVQDGHQLSTATFLAEQTIERARAAAWTDSPAVDCLGVSAGDAAPIPSGATCQGAASTRFPDETGGISGYPRYRRSVRVTSCAPTPCAGATTTGLRRVAVTVAYAPLTSAGVSPRPTTVRLEWLVAQK